MLNNRQNEILNIIEKYPVSDQKELIGYLSNLGIYATQATVSRDIHKLRIKKIRKTAPDGTVTVKYVSEPQTLFANNFPKFESLCRDALVSAQSAQNIVVIKTETGMAQAVCAAFDAIGFEHIVGSIAGDDTIFAVCKTNDDAQNTILMLNETAKKE